MPPAELDPLLAHSGPKLLLHGGEDGPAVRRLAAPPPALDLDDDYERRMDRSRGPALGAVLGRRDGIWYLLYTSGTTGRPKGVIYTYGMALANLVNIGTAIGLGASDTTSSFLPHFHTAGINLHALPTLLQGGRVLLLPGFDADAGGRAARGPAGRHLLRRARPSTSRWSTIPASPRRRSATCATGAAAERPCRTASPSAAATSASGSATAWA